MIDPRALIVRLEARLAADPGDVPLHFNLALFYDHLGRAPEARRAYLAYCVRSLGFSAPAVAETALAAEAARPGAPPIALLRLGELQAGLGRPDEAAGTLRRGTVWKTVTTPHYRWPH